MRNRRSLHYATPDFLLNWVALASFMRLSLLKGARAALSNAAWQEIRVRSGRDDNSFAEVMAGSVAPEEKGCRSRKSGVRSGRDDNLT